jgi:hypothetical protein
MQAMENRVLSYLSRILSIYCWMRRVVDTGSVDAPTVHRGEGQVRNVGVQTWAAKGRVHTVASYEDQYYRSLTWLYALQLKIFHSAIRFA